MSGNAFTMSLDAMASDSPSFDRTEIAPATAQEATQLPNSMAQSFNQLSQDLSNIYPSFSSEIGQGEFNLVNGTSAPVQSMSGSSAAYIQSNYPDATSEDEVRAQMIARGDFQGLTDAFGSSAADAASTDYNKATIANTHKMQRGAQATSERGVVDNTLDALGSLATWGARTADMLPTLADVAVDGTSQILTAAPLRHGAQAFLEAAGFDDAAKALAGVNQGIDADNAASRKAVTGAVGRGSELGEFTADLVKSADKLRTESFEHKKESSEDLKKLQDSATTKKYEAMPDTVWNSALKIKDEFADTFTRALDNPSILMETTVGMAGDILSGGAIAKLATRGMLAAVRREAMSMSKSAMAASGKQFTGAETAAIFNKNVASAVADPKFQAKLATTGERAALAYMALTDGSMNGTQAYEKVMGMSAKDLAANAPTYNKYIQMGMSEKDAKQMTALDVLSNVTLSEGVLAAVATKFSGMSKAIGTNELGAVKKAAVMTVGSGVENMSQGITGAATQNIEIKDKANTKQDLTEGVGEGAAMGLIGGIGAGTATGAPVIATSAAIGAVKGAKVVGKVASPVVKAGMDLNKKYKDASLAKAEKAEAANTNAVAQGDLGKMKPEDKAEVLTPTVPVDTQGDTNINDTNAAAEQSTLAKQVRSELAQSDMTHTSTAIERAVDDVARATLSDDAAIHNKAIVDSAPDIALYMSQDNPLYADFAKGADGITNNLGSGFLNAHLNLTASRENLTPAQIGEAEAYLGAIGQAFNQSKTAALDRIADAHEQGITPETRAAVESDISLVRRIKLIERGAPKMRQYWDGYQAAAQSEGTQTAIMGMIGDYLENAAISYEGANISPENMNKILMHVMDNNSTDAGYVATREKLLSMLDKDPNLNDSSRVMLDTLKEVYKAETGEGLDGVTKNIAVSDQKGFKSALSHVAGIVKAVNSGDKAQVNTLMGKLVNFHDGLNQKAAIFDQAYKKMLATGETQYPMKVTSNPDGTQTHTYYTGTTGKHVIIHKGSEGLIQRVNSDAATLGRIFDNMVQFTGEKATIVPEPAEFINQQSELLAQAEPGKIIEQELVTNEVTTPVEAPAEIKPVTDKGNLRNVLGSTIKSTLAQVFKARSERSVENRVSERFATENYLNLFGRVSQTPRTKLQNNPEFLNELVQATPADMAEMLNLPEGADVEGIHSLITESYAPNLERALQGVESYLGKVAQFANDATSAGKPLYQNKTGLMHLLSQTPEGTYYFAPEVNKALALSVMQFMGDSYKALTTGNDASIKAHYENVFDRLVQSDSDVTFEQAIADDSVARDEGYVTPSDYAEMAGKQVFRNMGITLDKGMPLNDKSALETSIGLGVLNSMVDAGYVGITSIKIDATQKGKRSISLIVPKGNRGENYVYPENMDEVSRTIKNANMQLGTSVYAGYAEKSNTFEAPYSNPMNTDAPVYYLGSPIELPKKIQQATQISANTPQYINKPLYEVMSALGGGDFMRSIMGYSFEGVAPIATDNIKGKNDGLDRNIQDMDDFVEAISLRGDYGSTPFYSPFRNYNNARIGMDAIGVNGQRNKPHRALVHNEPTTVDMTNTDQVNLVKLAIAQGLSIDIDKQTFAESLAQFDEVMADPTINDAIELLRKINADNFVEVSQADVNTVIAAVAKGRMEAHSFAALFEAAKLRDAGTTGTMQNTLGIEADGLNHGAFTALMQMGLSGAKSFKEVSDLLQKGGINLIDSRSYGEYKKPSNLTDLYEDAASSASDTLSDALSGRTTLPIKLVNAMRTEMPSMMALMSKYLDGGKSSVELVNGKWEAKGSRKLFKQFAMPVTAYAAGATTIRNTYALDVIKSMMAKFNDAHQLLQAARRESEPGQFSTREDVQSAYATIQNVTADLNSLNPALPVLPIKMRPDVIDVLAKYGSTEARETVYKNLKKRMGSDGVQAGFKAMYDGVVSTVGNTVDTRNQLIQSGNTLNVLVAQMLKDESTKLRDQLIKQGKLPRGRSLPASIRNQLFTGILKRYGMIYQYGNSSDANGVVGMAAMRPTTAKMVDTRTNTIAAMNSERTTPMSTEEISALNFEDYTADVPSLGKQYATESTLSEPTFDTFGVRVSSNLTQHLEPTALADAIIEMYKANGNKPAPIAHAFDGSSLGAGHIKQFTQQINKSFMDTMMNSDNLDPTVQKLADVFNAKPNSGLAVATQLLKAANGTDTVLANEAKSVIYKYMDIPHFEDSMESLLPDAETLAATMGNEIKQMLNVKAVNEAVKGALKGVGGINVSQFSVGDYSYVTEGTPMTTTQIGERIRDRLNKAKANNGTTQRTNRLMGANTSKLRDSLVRKVELLTGKTIPTPQDSPIAPSMVKPIEGNPVQGVLEALKASGDTVGVAVLKAVMKGIPATMQIEYVTPAEMNQRISEVSESPVDVVADGVLLNEDTILLVHGADLATHLHELVHAGLYNALTDYYINGNRTNAAHIKALELLARDFAVTKQTAPAVKVMQSVVNAALAQTDNYTAVQEFVAYMTSDPTIREIAMGTPMTTSTMKQYGNKLRQFIRSIAGLFGLTNSAKGMNYLTAALYHVNNLKAVDDTFTMDDGTPPLMKQSEGYESYTHMQHAEVMENLNHGNMTPEQVADVAEKWAAIYDTLAPVLAQRAAENGNKTFDQTLFDATLDSFGTADKANRLAAYGFRMSEQEAALYKALHALAEHSLDTLNNKDAAALYTLYNNAKSQIDPATFGKGKYEALFGDSLAIDDGIGKNDNLANMVALYGVSPAFREAMAKVTVSNKKADVGWLENAVRYAGDKVLSLLSAGTGSSKADIRLNNLLDRLTTVSAESRNTLYNKGNFAEETTNNLINGLEAKTKDALNAAQAKIAAKATADASLMTKAVDLAATIASTNEADITQLSDSMTGMIDSLGNDGNTRLGVLGELISEFKGASGKNLPYAKLLSVTKFIRDAARTRFLENTPNDIRDMFKNTKLTTENKAAVTTGYLRNGAYTLAEQYNMTELHNLYSDPKALNQAIQNAENTLTAEGLDTFALDILMNQVNGLGYYNVTGQSALPNQLRSITDITRLVNSEAMVRIHESVLGDSIKELAALYGIEHTSMSDRNHIAELIKQDGEAMKGVGNFATNLDTVEMHNATGQQAERAHFGSQAEINNPERDVRYATYSDGRELINNGYTRGQAIDMPSYDTQTGQLYIYYSDSVNRPAWIQGVMSIVNQTIGGIDGTRGSNSAGRAKKVTDSLGATQTLESQVPNYQGRTTLDASVNHPLPILGSDGSVRGYEYSIPRETLANRVEPNNDFADIMGTRASRNYEQKLANATNSNLVDLMVNDLRETAKTGLTNSFIRVSPNSADPRIQELYSKIPDSMKTLIRQKFPSGELLVRRTVLNNALGMREFSFRELLESDPKERNAFENAFVVISKALLGDKAAYRLGQGTGYMKEFAKVAKDTVIIRNLKVQAINMLSNLLQLRGRGVTFRDIATGTIEGYKHAEDYMDLSRTQNRLNNELIFAGTDKVKIAAINKELSSVTDRMRRNPAADLIIAGMLPTISAGTTPLDKYKTTTGLTGSMYRAMDSLPGGLATAAREVALRRDSKAFATLNKFNQYMDFSSKYVLYKQWTERAPQLMQKERAVERLMEEFVNYEFIPSRTRQFADATGLSWFLNYRIRSQKIIARMMRENPLHFLGQVGYEMGGYSTILDTNIVTHSGGFYNALGVSNGLRFIGGHPLMGVVDSVGNVFGTDTVRGR